MNTHNNIQLEEANKLIFVKKYEEAEKIILKLLRDDAFYNDPLVHLRSIELSVRLNRVKELIEIFDSITEKRGTLAGIKVAIVLAEQHGEIISALEAASQFQDLLKAYGGSAAIYYGIGFSMEVSGNLDRALYNYEQCINCDSEFYPGFFGLSQVYYQKSDEGRGDYYFKLFEESAPFNVYGNFESHRILSNEFLEKERYAEAEIAIRTLSEWWVDNKGACPPEIQIYEGYSLARIFELSGHQDRAERSLVQTQSIALQILSAANATVGVLYFIAKTLEEFSRFDLALQFYQKILSLETVDAEIVQRIGGQFLSMGEYELSRQLFENAYQHQPDNQEINFCLLIAKLRLAEVNVEDYLLSKERMKQLLNNPSDRVELLSVLHNLLSKFGEDPEVHANLGDVYLRLGNVDRARQHFAKMYTLDPLSHATGLKYAGFELQYGDSQRAVKILEELESKKTLSVTDSHELNWLRASAYLKEGNFKDSRRYLQKPLSSDPWNVSYVVFDLVNLIEIANQKTMCLEIDQLLEKLMAGDEDDLNWQAFEAATKVWEANHAFEIVYNREKLRFLYSNGDQNVLLRLVRAACSFDAAKATYDFLKLLNTNFDGPEIYWALGMLFKENWQLETACVWFEQILNLPLALGEYESMAFLELADCYIWRELNYDKALEYAKIAMSYDAAHERRAVTIMAHAYLRLGQVKQAEIYLEDAEIADNIEATYLRGLLHYRNGAELKANQVWKPLLTVRSENLRFHHIKQEILKYYFEKEPYFEIN